MQLNEVKRMVNALLAVVKPGVKLPEAVDERTIGPVLDAIIQGIGSGPRKAVAMGLNFGKPSGRKPSRKAQERTAFINTLVSTGMPLDRATAQADRML